MRIAQAVIPLFREQGHGSLVFISSSSTNNPMPFQVHYGASKAALTNWVYGLSAEVRGFGIKCMVIEPGGFKTQLGQPREGVRGGEGIGVLPGPTYKSLYDGFHIASARGRLQAVRHLSVEICRGEGSGEEAE